MARKQINAGGPRLEKIEKQIGVVQRETRTIGLACATQTKDLRDLRDIAEDHETRLAQLERWSRGPAHK